MKFILTRHCETDWNKEWLLQGHSDISLNENGWLQAEELAKNLSDLNIKKIVSSDLKRSMETSSVLLRYLKVPIEYDKRLRECNFGKLEGRSREDLQKLSIPEKSRPVLFTNKAMLGVGHVVYNDYDFTLFGGEARDAVLRRHLSLLDDLSEKVEAEEPILLVGHGTGLNTLLAQLKKSPIQRGEFAEIEYP